MSYTLNKEVISTLVSHHLLVLAGIHSLPEARLVPIIFLDAPASGETNRWLEVGVLQDQNEGHYHLFNDMPCIAIELDNELRVVRTKYTEKPDNKRGTTQSKGDSTLLETWLEINFADT